LAYTTTETMTYKRQEWKGMRGTVEKLYCCHAILA